MKKLLVAISFLLVAATLMVMPAFGAKSVDVDDLKWNVGQPIHAVEDATAKAPVMDGTIGKTEYTYKYRYEDHLYMTDRAGYEGSSNVRNAGVIPAEDNIEWASDYMELYVSYDEDYVYIGVYDVMFYQDKETRVCDTNFDLTLGLNMDNPNTGLRVGTIGCSGSVQDATKESDKNNMWNGNQEYVDGVIYKKCAESKAALTGSDSKGYIATYEYKFSKADLVALSNYYCGTDFEEFPNVFYISAKLRQWSGDKATDGSARYGIETFPIWFGKKLTNTDKLTLGTTWNNVPAIVVLGAEAEAEETTTEAATTAPVTTEPVVTEPVTTEPVVTEPATTEPVETTPVETTPVETESDTAAETEPAKGGCGSAISAMSVALVAVIGAGALVVSKKKED